MKSLDSFVIEGRGKVFIVESPIEAPRERDKYLEALGNTVTIDDHTYKVLGVEWHLPCTPVSKGERIGLLVIPR